LTKLTDLKNQYEAHYPICNEWWHFDVLSLAEKKRREQVWTDYYQSLKGNKYHSLFKTQVELFKSLMKYQPGTENYNDTLNMIKGIQQEAKEILVSGEYVSSHKPQFRDPFEFYHSSTVKDYVQ